MTPRRGGFQARQLDNQEVGISANTEPYVRLRKALGEMFPKPTFLFCTVTIPTIPTIPTAVKISTMENRPRVVCGIYRPTPLLPYTLYWARKKNRVSSNMIYTSNRSWSGYRLVQAHHPKFLQSPMSTPFFERYALNFCTRDVPLPSRSRMCVCVCFFAPPRFLRLCIFGIFGARGIPYFHQEKKKKKLS